MEVALFATAYTYIDQKLQSVMGAQVGSVMASVQPVLMTAVTLYIVLYGWAIIRGSIDEPIMDFIMRGVKLIFIIGFATTNLYNSQVATLLFTGMPDWLGQAVTGSANGGGAGKPFDQYFAQGLSVADSILKAAPPMDFASYFLSAFVVIFAAASAAIGFGIFMIAKVALALLVVLGPIFIACLVFEPSRRFFYGWLSQAVNYLVLYALMIVVFQMIVDFTFIQAESAGDDPIMRGYLFIALTILGTIFFLQVPALASGIAGGASTGLRDFANAVPKLPKSGGNGGGGGRGGGGTVSKK